MQLQVGRQSQIENLDLGRTPYVSYGVKYIGLVSLGDGAVFCQQVQVRVRVQVQVVIPKYNERKQAYEAVS